MYRIGTKYGVSSTEFTITGYVKSGPFDCYRVTYNNNGEVYSTEHTVNGVNLLIERKEWRIILIPKKEKCVYCNVVA